MTKLIMLTCALLFSSVQKSDKRLLYLYADKTDNAQLIEQQRVLNADKAGLNERDMVVKIVLQSDSPTLFVKKKIKSPFTVVLVGKDGGEKLRSSEIVSLKNLYRLIDAMPMRKAEMRNQ